MADDKEKQGKDEKEDLWTADRDRTLPKQPVEGAEEDPDEFFKAGVFLLRRDKVKEALTAFKRALLAKESEPRYMSFTGLCLALAQGKVREGLVLCEKAVEREFYRSELFLNLGRVYLLAGNRRKAHMAFRKGMALDRENRDIRAQLERMGVRKAPVFPFLDRRHPINKFAGKVLYRLRLR
jgi:tetratricopeptide (TPR) repeat protein